VAPAHAQHRADRRTVRQVVGYLRELRQRADAAEAAAEQAQVERRDAEPCDRGQLGRSFRGKLAASTSAQPSKRTTWTGAAARSSRVARRSRGNNSVPAAGGASSGRPPVSSACSVEGAALMTAAREPAARPARSV